MLEWAIVIGIVTVAGTWLATAVFITWSAENWGKEEQRWREWSVGDSLMSALLTVPATALWTGLPGLLGFGLAGEGGALVAVIVMAILTALGLAIVAAMSSPGLSDGELQEKAEAFTEGQDGTAVLPSGGEGGKRMTQDRPGSLEERWEERLRVKKRRPRGAEGARGADRELAEGGVETRKVTTYIRLPEGVTLPMPPVRDRAGYLRVRKVKVDIIATLGDLRAQVARVNMALRRSGQDAQADEFLGLVRRALTPDQVINAIFTYADPIGEGEEED